MDKNQKDTSPKSLKDKLLAKFRSSDIGPTKSHTDKSVSLGLVNEVNEFELLALSTRHYNKDENRTEHPKDLHLFENAATTYKEVSNNIADAERLKALDPNIQRIEQIITSSIMSPNDLQDVDPEITVELEGLDGNKKKRICTLLTSFYCGQYNLREKMSNWVKEAHFRSGAGVTMILPEATLTKIVDKYDPDRRMLKAKATEAYHNKDVLSIEEHAALEDSIITPDLLTKVKYYDAHKVPHQHTTGQEGIRNSSSKLYVPDSVRSDIILDDKRSVRHVVEMVCEEYLGDISYPISKNYQAEFRTAVESMALNFKKALKEDNEQSYVNVVNNPDVIQVGKLLKKKQTKQYHDILEDSVLKNLLKGTNGDNTVSLYHRDIPIMDLTSEMTEYDKQKAFPFWLNLPTESVIPICIPGSKKDKIGYFILIDAYGQPIEASNYIISNNNNPISSRLSMAYNAMYGEMPTESGIRTQSGVSSSSTLTRNMCDGSGKDAITKVFNYILDELLKKKLSKMGLTDVNLGTYNSIATCMLYRLLDKKQTNLVFVPEKYITYMAFNYHYDGTGKNKIEDIIYMESLKVCFNTANSLAIMKSAVPVKKVKVNLTKDQSASMQVLYAIRDAIVQKEKFVPSTYPATITSQMIAQNLSIEATHPNAEAFSYTIEDTHREIPKADTDYLKEIDNNTIVGLGLYPSALNESSEVQFARSLATTNLYYSKSIRDDQVIVEKFATSHVRNHLALSSVLIYKIADILTSDKDAEKKDPTDIKPTTADGSTSIGEISKRITPKDWENVLKIIDNVQVKLSPPDMLPNDTQYVMLTEIMKRIEEYVNNIYPDDIGTYGEEDLSQPLRIFKAYVKSQMITEVANKIGFKGLLSNVPDMESFLVQNTTKIKDILGMLNGIKESILRETLARKKKQDQHSDESSDDGSSGGNEPW